MRLLILLLLLVHTGAQARLFETLEQCIARYGKPDAVEDSEDFYRFEKAPFKILVFTDAEKRCQSIIYSRIDGEHIDEVTLAYLAETNLPKAETVIDGSVWKNADGMAQYTRANRLFSVTSAEGAAALEKLMRDMAAKKLNGF